VTLCVLCVSVVENMSQQIHHRDTEKILITESMTRSLRLAVL